MAVRGKHMSDLLSVLSVLQQCGEDSTKTHLAGRKSALASPANSD